MKLFQSKKAQAKQSGMTNAKPCAPASASASDRHANAEFLAHAMDEHGDMVLRLALSQMRDMADAEDVFQDVFVRLMNARMNFTSSEHLKAWLIRTTVNRCRDLQRARTRKQKRTEPLCDRHAETLPDRQTAPPGFEPDVWHAVGTLPDDQRMAVHLHYVEGYSTEEIARIADCTPATIRTRLFRAREAMRRELDKERAPAAKQHAQATSKDAEARPAACPNRNSTIRPHNKQKKRQATIT